MKTITVIDNYDSFVYNLVRYVRDTGCKVNVQRNDALDYDEIAKSDGIILSPGPGIPLEAGQLLDAIQEFGTKKPVLGVCLGHQAIAQSFGGSLDKAMKPIHGKASTISHDSTSPIFQNIPSYFDVGRYHSWIVRSLPDSFRATSYSIDGEIMSFEHTELPIYGVQFHPESILTPNGRTIISNWINL